MIIFSNSLDLIEYIILLKRYSVVVQIANFYFVCEDNFSENVDISKSKFEYLVFELFNSAYLLRNKDNRSMMGLEDIGEKVMKRF